MFEENMSQEFKLKTVDEIRNSLIEEVNRNELMSKKHKKVCRDLNYVNHLLVAISTINGCVFTSAFASLVGIPVGITSSVIGLKICVIIQRIKNYKSIIKTQKEEMII